MFCGNCGKELPDNAQFCGNCGAKKGENFSPVNSSPVFNNQPIYSSYSYNAVQKIEGTNYPPGYIPKKWITALLLLIFLGAFGAHRFYVRKIGTAIIMLGLTLLGYYFAIRGSINIASYNFPYYDYDIYDFIGYYIGSYLFAWLIGLVLLIWWIIDLVNICTSKFKDKECYLLSKT